MGFFDFFSKNNIEKQVKKMEEYIFLEHYEKFSTVFKKIKENGCPNYISFKIKYLIVNNKTNMLFDVIKDIEDINELKNGNILDDFDFQIIEMLKKESNRNEKEENLEEKENYYEKCIFKFGLFLREEKEKFCKLVFDNDKNDDDKKNVLLSLLSKSIDSSTNGTVSFIMILSNNLDVLDMLMNYNPDLLLKHPEVPKAMNDKIFIHLSQDEKYRKIIMTDEFLKKCSCVWHNYEIFNSLKSNEKNLFKYYQPFTFTWITEPFLNEEQMNNCRHLVKKYLCEDEKIWNDSDIEKITNIIFYLSDFGNAKNIFIEEVQKGNKEIINTFLSLRELKYFENHIYTKHFCSKLFLLIVKEPDLVSKLIELSKKTDNLDDEDIYKDFYKKLKTIHSVSSSTLSSPNGRKKGVFFNYSQGIITCYGDGTYKSIDASHQGHTTATFKSFFDYFKNDYEETILNSYKENDHEMSARLAFAGVITILVENETACVWLPNEISDNQFNSLIELFDHLSLSNKKVSFYSWKCEDDESKLDAKMKDVESEIMGINLNFGTEMTYDEFINELENTKKNSIKKR